MRPFFQIPVKEDLTERETQTYQVVKQDRNRDLLAFPRRQKTKAYNTEACEWLSKCL